ncbi:hypothetical protein [Paenibacillus paeoniae]|uniref:Uncharacterized protein n=1 Tax=Paenibacillus paeoniae TaxID=2292705 RepID=A0A371P7G2_9BACL|nr:hypothetical protein [Paenibacillus paeoniae]REK71859.1 hypothetical protein DX130_19310 [Paenibacillus paeoniae]
MSESRSDWQDAVKRGLFGKAEFNEEMKRSVLKEIDQTPAMQFHKHVRFIGMAALCVIVGAVLFYSTNGTPWGEHASQQAGVVEPTQPNDSSQVLERDAIGLPVTFRYLEAKTLQKDEVIWESDEDILPGLSNKHSPLWKLYTAVELPLDEVEILDQRHVEGIGSVIRFTKMNDTATQHGTDEKYDYIGFVIDGLSKPNTLLHYGLGHLYDDEILMTRLFGKEVIKIDVQTCRTDGESCAFYIHELDGSITTYAMFDAASYEYDLDNDGREEAIVTTYKQNQIYVFKEENGELLWASIRDSLGADHRDIVSYDRDKGWFTIRDASSGDSQGSSVLTYRYEAATQSLVEVQP